MVNGLRIATGFLLCLWVMQAASPAGADTNRAIVIDKYDRLNTKAVEFYEKDFKRVLASCDDCDVNTARRDTIRKQMAQYTAFSIYYAAQCEMEHLDRGGDPASFNQDQLEKCGKEKMRVTLISTDLLGEYIVVDQDRTLRCMVDSRLPEDDIDFPVHPTLALIIGDAMPVKHYDLEKLTRCLRS
jgi:hypothetical protein